MAFVIILIILILVILAGFVYYQSKGFVVEKYDFSSNKIHNDFNFVFLSDLHETQHDENNTLLLDKIHEISPDYVLIGGDMITSYKKITDDFYKTLELIKTIGIKYKTIYVPGNHERALYDLRDCNNNTKRKSKDITDIQRINELEQLLEESGITLLRNAKCVIGDFEIIGLDLPLDYYRRLIRRAPEVSYMQSLIGKIDDDKYSIMLAHDPEHFKEYSKLGIDLTLSGHLHGGIVRIPGIGGVISPQLKLFPKYDSGVFELANSSMLISRGIGTHSLPIRVFNRAEVCNVTIRSTIENGV